MQTLTYGVLKTYKGLLKKTHIGNEQILVVPLSKTFMVLNLIGSMKDGRSASQLILRMGIEMLPSFLQHYSKVEKFIPVETLPCVARQTSINDYKVELKKPGRHIKSNLDISFDPNYSTGNVKIYMIDGKFDFNQDEYLDNPTHLKMSAQRHKAYTDGILSKFLSKFMR